MNLPQYIAIKLESAATSYRMFVVNDLDNLETIWLIEKEVANELSYARGYTDVTAAWTARASLTYKADINFDAYFSANINSLS
jgi:hypothetical protein